MKVAVLSDTHAPRFWKSCPPGVAHRLADVEQILHAGDVCTPSVLDELSHWAPVTVVQGNNDGPDVAAWGASEQARFSIDGLTVGMIHDSGPKEGRPARLRRLFPDRQLVVFGHSHIPYDVTVDGQRYFNPGSPTDKRRQPHRTMGLLEISDGRLESAEIIELD